MKWFVKCIQNYVNFRGRARRAEFWYFALFSLIIYVVAMILDALIFGRPQGLFYFCSYLFLVLPSLAVSVRRLHDTGRSGKILLWYYVAAFVWMILLIATGASFLMSAMQGAIAASPSVLFFVVLFGGLLGFLVWGIFFLVWFCMAGDRGDNRYGPDPKAIAE